MKNKTKGKLLRYAAVALDVAVPLIATLTQFPVWTEKSSEATVSGLFLVFAFLSALPFIKQIKAFLKSPSVPVIWVVILVFLVCLRNIISEMIIVCFWGTIANAVGMGIYKIGEAVGSKADREPAEKTAEEDSEA